MTSKYGSGLQLLTLNKGCPLASWEFEQRPNNDENRRLPHCRYLRLSKLSKATFQQSIDSLKQAADFRAGRCGYEDDTSLWPVEFYEDPEGYYHLHGRDKLALSVHKQVLPLYGFTADKHGVQEMLQLCAKYLSDPEFAHLFDSVNAKLGMSPSACQRFRQLIAGYEPLPTGKARS